jgi:hypothetical protein
VEALTVANWLHRPQRFRVVIERLAADAATKLEGSEHIDVPGGAERQYKLAFYAYTQVGVRGGYALLSVCDQQQPVLSGMASTRQGP